MGVVVIKKFFEISVGDFCFWNCIIVRWKIRVLLVLWVYIIKLFLILFLGIGLFLRIVVEWGVGVFYELGYNWVYLIVIGWIVCKVLVV